MYNLKCMSITYRKATIKDTDVLYKLGVELNSFYLESSSKKESLFWEGWEKDFETEIAEELSNPSKYIYLAEDADKNPVGYIIAILCKHCQRFEIDQLYVKDGYRGLKVGKSLLDLVIAAGKSDFEYIHLEVYKNNTKAIEFYKKYGFEDEGIVMRKQLGV